MEIAKNDVVNLVNSLKYNQAERRGQQSFSYAKNMGDQQKASSHVQLDQVRHKAMRLDDEIRELQTYITKQQIQLGFLEDVHDSEDWSVRLTSFLEKKSIPSQGDFKNSQVGEVTEKSIFAGKSLDEYQQELREDVQKAKQSLNKSQIKLQNIFASGLISEPDINKNMPNMKNAHQMTDVFKSLRTDAVNNLLSHS